MADLPSRVLAADFNDGLWLEDVVAGLGSQPGQAPPTSPAPMNPILMVVPFLSLLARGA
jgi:hypothetical protein